MALIQGTDVKDSVLENGTWVDKTTTSTPTTTTTSTPTTTTSASTGTTTSNTSSTESIYQAYLAQLAAQQAAQQALRDEAAAVASAAQQSTYDASVADLTSQAEDSQRSNYVDMMQDDRRLSQLLTAQGITGGASETTAANMYNNYISGQNSVNESLADNTTSLAQTLASNLAAIESERLTGNASDLSDYNTSLSNVYSSYLSAIADLDAAAGTSTSTSSGTTGTSTYNYDDASALAVNLALNGYTQSQIDQMFTMLGI